MLVSTKYDVVTRARPFLTLWGLFAGLARFTGVCVVDSPRKPTITIAHMNRVRASFIYPFFSRLISPKIYSLLFLTIIDFSISKLITVVKAKMLNT